MEALVEQGYAFLFINNQTTKKPEFIPRLFGCLISSVQNKDVVIRSTSVDLINQRQHGYFVYFRFHCQD